MIHSTQLVEARKCITVLAEAQVLNTSPKRKRGCDAVRPSLALRLVYAFAIPNSLARYFPLRPKVHHTSLLGSRHNLTDNCSMGRHRGIGLQTFFVVEREHEAVREAVVVGFRTIIRPPLKRLDRLALRRQLC